MPVYEYQCPLCHTCDETLLSIGASHTVELWCPNCNVLMERVLSRSVVRGGDTPKFHRPPKTEDAGFKREWDEVWKPDNE